MAQPHPQHAFGIPDKAKPFLAGSIAGIVTKTSTAPLERIKTLLQVEGMSSRGAKVGASSSGIMSTTRLILARDGVRGFWYGNFANCLRVVPVYALKFGFNDIIKDVVRKSPDEKLSFLQLIASGTLAGLFQMTITYPLETIRTRLTVGAVFGAQYRGIWHCLTSTVKHEGVLGLYKGLGATILSGPLYVGLQMSSFEMLSRQTELLALVSENKTIQAACCGALAGMFAQTITYPGDTIRKRLQTNGIRGTPKIYRGLIHCAVTVAQNEGVGTFFAGLGANLIRGIPSAAIQFAAFGFWKNFLQEHF